VAPGLAGCGRLDELIYAPPTTPQQWCEQRPCIAVGGTVLDEPLGSALVLGGIGAALAGVSYQAFGYVLKCAGHDLCLLTDGFEVGYSVTQALSVSAMLIAVSCACATAGLRQGLIAYAALNAVVYGAISIAGVMMPSAPLLSYVVLMLFALPGILVIALISTRRYLRNHDALDQSLMISTFLLIVVQAAYFAYQSAGLTATLWDDGRGTYFSENDVLHIGMMFWLAYVTFVVGKRLRDEPANPAYKYFYVFPSERKGAS
jgi:hypothetical protein